MALVVESIWDKCKEGKNVFNSHVDQRKKCSLKLTKVKVQFSLCLNLGHLVLSKHVSGNSWECYEKV